MDRATTQVEREAGANWVRLRSPGCTFTFERLRPGRLLVTITGYDRGECGTAPLDEIIRETQRYGPLELLIDASQARGVTWAVSEQWTQWFHANQHHLRSVLILVQSKYVEQTILVAKELSKTRHLLSVTSDAEAFATHTRETR